VRRAATAAVACWGVSMAAPLQAPAVSLSSVHAVTAHLALRLLRVCTGARTPPLRRHSTLVTEAVTGEGLHAAARRGGGGGGGCCEEGDSSGWEDASEADSDASTDDAHRAHAAPCEHWGADSDAPADDPDQVAHIVNLPSDLAIRRTECHGHSAHGTTRTRAAGSFPAHTSISLCPAAHAYFVRGCDLARPPACGLQQVADSNTSGSRLAAPAALPGHQAGAKRRGQRHR